jgi:hypothetical protein
VRDASELTTNGDNSRSNSESHGLEVPDEDMKEAKQLVAKHNLQALFDKIKKIITDYRQSRADASKGSDLGSAWNFVKETIEVFQEGDDRPTGDLFALLGGVKLMVQLYYDLMKSANITYMTDELLGEAEDDSPLSLAEAMRTFWVDSTDGSHVFGCKLAEEGLFPHLAEDIKHLPPDFDVSSNI